MEQSKVKQIFIEMLAQGHSVNITAGGVSMVPFLLPRTLLRVVPCNPSDLLVGDVALFDRPGDILIAHRVVAQKDDALVFRGDSCLQVDGSIANGRIVGKVVWATWGIISYSVDGAFASAYRWMLFNLAPVSYWMNHALAWLMVKIIRLRSFFVNSSGR